MTDAAEIEENFIVLAEVLETITEQTFDGLNKGLRKDQIVNSIELPARLANHSTMNTQYVSAKDIAKMLLKQYTGWWDDIPSNWSPAAKEAQGAEIVALAGGIDKLVAHTRAVLASDVVMASHLADWAWLAEPGDSAVQQLVIDVYRARVIEPATNTQEMLTYIDQMAQARSAQLAAQ
jgi:alkyl sulfatase BDS1-like metallo-beta-lactamase superfamily hydrolase